MKNHITISFLLGKQLSIGQRFLKQTRLSSLKNMLPPSKWPKRWKTVYFKDYIRLNKIVLPQPELESSISLKDTLYKRTSNKQYSQIPLSIEKLSTLLYYSAGLKINKAPWRKSKFYPSAGSLYPLEIYIISLNTEIPKGLYHYNLRSHSLEQLQLFQTFPVSSYFYGKEFKKAACIVIVTGCFYRTTVKYQDRGYRYIFQEAGHMGQNLYLLSAALNINCCGIGGFTDNKINELLDIDGMLESALSVFALGNKSK